MDRPDALGGLNPADLLKQGAAEDTIFERSPLFTPPTLEELARIFPQFEVLEMIGQGGMGAVYKVRQKALDRVAALKILPPAIGEQPGFSQSFTREAKALAKLNHPGIVTLYEFGREEDLYYFLMEYVDGMNLRQLLRKERISPREAMAIVPQICDALQYAHDQGIVHRDIKPENLLLDRRGKVKVADFGIAKVVAAGANESTAHLTSLGETSDFTISGKIVGTPDYMAPEQIDSPGEVDHRADIYALGVVFYQMLTGGLPGKKIEIPSRKIHVDVRLDEVVLRALEKSPAQRYQQADAFKTQVEDIAGSPERRDLFPKKIRNFHYFWVLVPLCALAFVFCNPWGSEGWIWYGQGWMWFGAVCGLAPLLRAVIRTPSHKDAPATWVRIMTFGLAFALLGAAVFFATYKGISGKARYPAITENPSTEITQINPQQISEQWLGIIDAGNYETSWDEAASAFHEDVSKKAWKDALDSVRKPLGQLVSRKLLSKIETVANKAPLEKAMVIMNFTAEYEKKICRETVTFAIDKDNVLRPAGYLIQSVQTKGLLVIELFNSGEILMDGEVYSLDSLKKKLLEFLQAEPEKAFVLKSNGSCPAYFLDKVMTVLAEAGIHKISFEQGDESSITTVFQRAQQWLEIIDQGDYLKSWDESAEHFRKLVPRENWCSLMSSVRQPLGKRLERQFVKEQEAKSLPGGPEGDYLIMSFKSQFERLNAATETVTSYKEKDGTWRVYGYYIREDAIK